MSTTTTLAVHGLDGANPLHMLAAIGILRLSHRLDPASRMSWHNHGGTWQPRVHLSEPLASSWPATAVAWLNALGTTGEADPKLNQEVGKLKKQFKDAVNAKKEAVKKAKEHAKKSKLSPEERISMLTDIDRGHDRDLTKLQDAIAQAQQALAQALGNGPAHLGDIIGIDAALFRSSAQTALNAWLDHPRATGPVPRTDDPSLTVEQYAALASDVITDGAKVQPTSYSFGNGSSGQCLLKDFRNLATQIREEHLQACLTGEPGGIVPGVTGLNWDPADQRSYALTWYSPEDKSKNPKQTDITANCFAYLGLGALTAAPVGKDLQANGWGWNRRKDHGWTWPIWDGSLTYPVVKYLLADPGWTIDDPEQGRLGSPRLRGIHQVFRCDRINPTGKRNFFAPAYPVA